jgi:mRNA-degrading endonuclease RelE of RelBE toxin-antitoxin system
VSWQVIWRRQASDVVDRLARRDPALARRILQRAAEFAQHGQGDVKKLSGAGEHWRLRVGEWRVIFVFDPPGSITVLAVSNRRDAYR